MSTKKFVLYTFLILLVAASMLAFGNSSSAAAAQEDTALSAAGFNSQFNGSAAGWGYWKGGKWYIGSTTCYTNGVSGKYSSLSYNQTFGNFTYQARVKRVSAGTSSSGLIVRGTPVLDSYNDWKTAYEFLYQQSGNFGVWKGVNGKWTALKGWTSSSVIAKNGWNTLKVIASGSQFRFYINGKLVWTGSDSAIKTGQVGFSTFSTGKMEVDWATLTSSKVYPADEQVEEGQVELTGPSDRSGSPMP